MGANNPNYIPSKYFQEGILDKDTGEPLAAGLVYSWADEARTIPKPLYAKVDASPTNNYVALPNPVTLSSIGTFNYCGNDIIPYFYPYDENGNLELYFIDVVSAGGEPQFTRENIPDLSSAQPDEETEEINYIPNGQFSSHNNIFKSDPSGEDDLIVDDITELAPGFWTYERSTSSTAKDYVIFERFGSATSNPTGNPRYAVRIKCEVVNVGDTFKGLRVKFRDVNKFTSPSQSYNFSFSAKTNIGTSTPLAVNLIKNYGTGGDAEESIPLSTFNITDTYDTYNLNHTFDSNEGKTIGSDDDDFIQLEIAFPANALFDMSFTNFVLIVGDEFPLNYPVRIISQDFYKSIMGALPIPDYDGENLYLPIMMGKNGFQFDDSQIGRIIYKSIDNLSPGELYCNGDSYLSAEYSTDGIPYKRLFDKLWDNTFFISTYGSGKTFVNCFPFVESYPIDTNKIYLCENSFGDTTALAEGTTATGFTFNTEQAGVDYETSAFFSIQTVDSSLIPEGAYFKFYTPTNFDNRKFLVWFSFLDSSTEPSETADGKIKVLLESGDVDKDVAKKMLIAINQFYYAVPDYRGRFLRTDDVMGGDISTAAYNDRDADRSIVGIYVIDNKGSGYAVGDIVEIDSAGSPNPTAKVKILTIGGSGEPEKVKLVVPGQRYDDLSPGRYAGKATTAITGSGTGLTLSIEVGELRRNALLMDEYPYQILAGHNIGSLQDQDTSGSIVCCSDDEGQNPWWSYFSTDDSGRPYGKNYKSRGGSGDRWMAQDILNGKRKFDIAHLRDVSDYAYNTDVDFGYGHETRPKNTYVVAVIKY